MPAERTRHSPQSSVPEPRLPAGHCVCGLCRQRGHAAAGKPPHHVRRRTLRPQTRCLVVTRCPQVTPGPRTMRAGHTWCPTATPAEGSGHTTHTRGLLVTRSVRRSRRQRGRVPVRGAGCIRRSRWWWGRVPARGAEPKQGACWSHATSEGHAGGGDTSQPKEQSACWSQSASKGHAGGGDASQLEEQSPSRVPAGHTPHLKVTPVEGTRPSPRCRPHARGLPTCGAGPLQPAPCPLRTHRPRGRRGGCRAVT